MITVGDGFVEGKGILENYEGHDMFIVSGSGSGTGISVTDGYGSGTMVNVGNGQGSGNNVVVGDGHVSGLDIAGNNGELSGSDLTAGHGEGSGSGAQEFQWVFVLTGALALRLERVLTLSVSVQTCPWQTAPAPATPSLWARAPVRAPASSSVTLLNLLQPEGSTGTDKGG